MRVLRTVGVVFFSLTFSIRLPAQTPEQDPFQGYEAFLVGHKDMTTSELLALHPAGDFKEQAGVPWESVLYHEVVDAACALTAYEKSLLEDQSFLVAERFPTNRFIDQMVFIWNHDLPVFVSTDAILHALGVSYDRILADLETGVLAGRLQTLLSEMHKKLPDLAARYSADARMGPMLRDVDVYLTIPRRLLGQNVSPCYPDHAAQIDHIAHLIDAAQFAAYPLFSASCKEIDFSQFTPRGHYAQDPQAARYFRAMMWLGRVEMALSAPPAPSGLCPPQTPEDIRRQTIDALLVSELMDLAGVNSVWAEMEQVLSFLVGEQDNATLAGLRSLAEAVHLENAGRLWDEAMLQQFQNALRTQAFASPRILSQVLRSDPLSPQGVQPASAFLLFGQRFILDSYITGNVVFDRIKYQGQTVCRLFPSTLDVLFALGNNASGDLLIPELDQYHYASNLAALRYLVDAHDADFWGGSIYNRWLHAIRALNPPAERGHLPIFMQTAAWSREKMNTQLAAWAELRHAHVLYAKQSYTPGGSCSTPCGYVEPYPELYLRLSDLAKAAHLRFGDLAFTPNYDYYKTQILDYFDVFGRTTGTLAAIAQKELDGTVLTADETTFLQDTILSDWQRRGYNGPRPPQGWYSSLFYQGPFDLEPMVVDYHTVPSDAGGNLTGWVLHAGTGPADLAIVTAKMPGGETTAFVGPVLSYYEYTTTGFQRLTDEQWQDTYLAQASRPDWVSSYLTDLAGESKTPDSVTVAVVDDFESYRDGEGKRIYQTWIDGSGPEPNVPGNGTRSSVGNESAPFAEQKVVYGGRQSMPLDYNNVNEPWYSQANRTWQTPQDWTAHEADALTLYFRGKAGNGQDPLYVEIEDRAGRMARATHPRANAVCIDHWQRWRIPLADVRAAGVEVTAVKRMVIGVGGRENPKPGGAGRIYTDDILLTKRAP